MLLPSQPSRTTIEESDVDMPEAQSLDRSDIGSDWVEFDIIAGLICDEVGESLWVDGWVIIIILNLEGDSNHHIIVIRVQASGHTAAQQKHHQ